MTNEERYADYKWIKVKRHTDDPTKSWEERYKVLDEHHLKETTFLINEVRALAKELDAVSTSEKKLKKDEQREAFIRTFLVMWFGFSIIPVMIVDSFVDKQLQHQYNHWILGGSLLFGLACSALFTYYKWKKNDTD